MNRVQLWLGRLGLVTLGYLIAVLAASAVLALVILFTGASAPRPLGWKLSSFPLVMLVAASMTVRVALPGFLLAVTTAGILRWKSPLPYTLAGGLNGIISLGVLYSFTGVTYMQTDELFGHSVLTCIVGGLAGGRVFYTVCGRYLGAWRKPRA